MFPKQGTNERRFARAVRADQTDRVATHERCIEIAHENALANLHGRMLADYAAIPAALGDLEANGHRSFFTNRSTQPRQTLETLASTLGLFAVLSRDVPGDIVLLGRDLSLLLVELSLLRQSPKRALFDERLVTSLVGCRAVALEMQDVIDDCR